MAQQIRSVTLVGAGGNIGTAILGAIENDPLLTVTILSRQNSRSTFASHIKVIEIHPDYPFQELVEAFRGQNAVVSAIASSGAGVQKRMITAAVEAGVKRFIPAEFGGSPTHPRARELLPMFGVQDEIIALLRSHQSTGISWSALAPGPFFDWGLRNGLLAFDLAAQKAVIYDSGLSCWSATTITTIGRAVVGILKNPEKTANRHVVVQSFSTTQMHVVSELERYTGKKWDLQQVRSEDVIKQAQEQISKGDYSAVVKLIQATIYGSEDRGSDFATHLGLDNDMLGLPKESVGEVVSLVLNS
ncbi:hypothetical protein LTR17_024735 [Elasticomyces elasticus]|nr:hypothetical protein LTR17_024735 [Elasticomyces elasticus]